MAQFAVRIDADNAALTQTTARKYAAVHDKYKHPHAPLHLVSIVFANPGPPAAAVEWRYILRVLLTDPGLGVEIANWMAAKAEKQ